MERALDRRQATQLLSSVGVTTLITARITGSSAIPGVKGGATTDMA